MANLLSFLPKEFRSELNSIAEECQTAIFDFDFNDVRCQSWVIQIWTARELYKLRENIQYEKTQEQLKRALDRD